MIKCPKMNIEAKQDLLIQILLRLPVKSILRFRCVCKLWLSLISDPHFAKLHFEFDSTRTQRLVLFNADASEIKSIDFNAPSLHDDSTCAVIKLNFLPPDQQADVLNVCCCRGFILLSCDPNFYLWNPTTRVHKQIPCPPRTRPFSPQIWGFGYDPSTDDYLVPLVSFDIYKNLCNSVNHVYLFSFRANTWKELECVCFPYTTEWPSLTAGLLFNGAIHWIVERWVASHEEQRRDVIVVFDLMERSFSEIDLPCDLYRPELQVYGGCLGLYTQGYTLWHHDRGIAGSIWVMEEYKVQSSWSKRDIVVSIDDIGKFLSPVCFTKSGDIVGEYDQGLVKFNNKGEVQEYRFHHTDRNRWRQNLIMYRESLLSLPGDS